MKRAVKKGLLAAYTLKNRVLEERCGLVLLYHSVRRGAGPFTVTPRQFERQMRYLKHSFEIVSLDELLRIVASDEKPCRGAVAVTFDDGFRDNYVNAFPILREHGIPATIFVATGHTGREMSLDGETLKMLDWAELRGMQAGGMDFGAHSHSHRKLTELSAEEARDDIMRSKSILQEKLGREVRHFAYPKGHSDGPLRELVRASGFRSAFSLDEGLIRKGDGLFVLRRNNVGSGITDEDFREMTNFAYDGIRRLRTACRRLLPGTGE